MIHHDSLSTYKTKRVIIQTTRFLINIAQNLEAALQKAGYVTAIKDAAQIDVIMRQQTVPRDVFFIFLFVWHVQTLPMNNPFVIYNLEQVQRYKEFPHIDQDPEKRDRIENAFRLATRIFDYSLANIENYPSFMQDKAVFFPIPWKMQAIPSFVQPIYDIIFFGSMTERRLAILKSIKDNTSLNLLVIRGSQGKYGQDLYKAIRSAKLVLNIHAEKDSLLETARLHDCLCCGHNKIISEKPSLRDSAAMSLYSPVINFVEEVSDDLSNIDVLMAMITDVLTGSKSHKDIADGNNRLAAYIERTTHESLVDAF